MTSLPNTYRWFPAGIHKLDYKCPIYIDAFELLRVIMENLEVFFNYGCYKIIYYSFLVFLDKFQFSTRIY